LTFGRKGRAAALKAERTSMDHTARAKRGRRNTAKRLGRGGERSSDTDYFRTYPSPKQSRHLDKTCAVVSEVQKG